MIRIDSIKISAKKNTDIKEFVVAKYLSHKEPTYFKIIKKSVDSRKKDDILYIYSVALITDSKLESVLERRNINISFYKEIKYTYPSCDDKSKKVCVVGLGPAGLFCAYILALSGLKPIVIERGKEVDERTKDVEMLFDNGTLNINSNVLFGEGGAGTFSDGKLNTQIKDKEGRIDFVLETFYKFGAKEDIVYDAKPHIGTDILRNVVKNMRLEIEKLGGVFYFNTQFVSLETDNNKLTALKLLNVLNNESTTVECDYACLALGHSARDTFYYLKNVLNMSKKPFAVGFRVIHSQEFINKAQYGDNYANIYENLPQSPYKVTFTDPETERGVYSFCMCPGGYVVNASSEEEKMCINGMSYSNRNSGYANSAILVQVNPDDFDGDVLSGVEFQRDFESKAYNLCNGKIPVSDYSKFSGFECNESNIKPESAIKGLFEYADLTDIYPNYINKAFISGMEHFDKTIKGFARENPLIAGVETRSSCPLRIERDTNFESNIKGVFPCGEGAGYAGGIVSAAVDGIKTAEKIINYGN